MILKKKMLLNMFKKLRMLVQKLFSFSLEIVENPAIVENSWVTEHSTIERFYCMYLMHWHFGGLGKALNCFKFTAAQIAHAEQSKGEEAN